MTPILHKIYILKLGIPDEKLHKEGKLIHFNRKVEHFFLKLRRFKMKQIYTFHNKNKNTHMKTINFKSMFKVE